ncbi:uncharacterized protein [Rutidosis leptorrhynchoides]|uniref:uncharacterized protein n=1 Tax=Rutidosis leptorrhynchoides TaxID=125765 RepID=UPI003A999F7D
MIQIWHSGHVRKAEVLEEWECEPITFPAFWKVCPTDLPLTITATIGHCRVSRIYIDTGSAVDVIYEHCFLQMPRDVRDKVKPSLHPVAGFTGETTWPLGRVSINVTLGDDHRFRTVQLTFMVVHSQSKYNALQLCFRIALQFVLKFASRFSRRHRCLLLARVRHDESTEGDSGTPFERKSKHNTGTSEKERLAHERIAFLCNELEKLVDANILREVRYQTWVANSVLVKKANGTWHMCANFKDINKACPKDNYQLPENDWNV